MKGCTNVRAPASVNLYKHKTKADLFLKYKHIEETLSYGRYTLANFQNSQCQNTTDYIKSPSVHSSIIFVDGQHTDRVILSQRRWLTHFSQISTIINTSLKSITSGSEYNNKNAGTHFIYAQQAHLSGIIVVTKKLNLIGNICLNNHIPSFWNKRPHLRKRLLQMRKW